MSCHFARDYKNCFNGISSCCCFQKFLLVFCCPLISFFVSNITFFCWVEALLWYIIHIIIHTIQDPVYKIWYLSDFRRVQVEQKSSSLRFRCRDYPSLNPCKENLLHLLVYWYACFLVETKMQWHYFHKDSFGMWTVVYCCLHFFKVASEINPDLVVFFFLMLFM